jgi:hypothetical protein
MLSWLPQGVNVSFPTRVYIFTAHGLFYLSEICVFSGDDGDDYAL